MDRAIINTKLTEALLAVGTKQVQYGNWQGFAVAVRGDFARFTVTVSPTYRAKEYGARHSTFFIKRDADLDEKIRLVVTKAKECADADRESVRRIKSAGERKEQRTALMREAARAHFPDFEYSGTSRDGIYLNRKVDGCDVSLVVDGDGTVAVREVRFERIYMTIEEAQKLVAPALTTIVS